PEELITIGEKEFAWCEAEIRKAAAELGLSDHHAALEYIKSLHRPPGGQPEMIRAMAVEAVEFLEAHDLVTLPPLAVETWRMEMMTPEAQLVNPFFLGGEMIQVSFPTDTMTHAQKQMSMRGNNPHFARATVQHELMPGHHLQMFMMSRYRPYRRTVGTSFWIEGWALYWEMRLWDLGFPQTPENRLGMLFWRSHRAARIVFSLKFHLEQMTAPECIAMLIERVGHEPANAEAEVRRSFKGDYGPLYQAAYMLGGLQMKALHGELVEQGSLTDRAFHDAILRQNSLPIEMLRAALTQQPLTRDFISSWRFYPDA
ncbi:MAG: X-Pro dipeptidyl-peptidase, partial [Chthonomonadales bacterium]|nr:X-Pro dipeptidyl-peptidase [Chthonomonadales bacterium]